MHWQARARLGVGTVVMGTIVILATGCGSSGKATTVTEAWNERPRFFTPEPGEEHSKFSKVVWYERPRFFTTAEGEDQSKFSTIWDNRPRIFTKRPVARTSGVYPTYETTTHYQTIPVKSEDGIHRNCNCPHHRHGSSSDRSTPAPIRTETTFMPESVEADSQTHIAHVQLTSDRSNAENKEDDAQQFEFDTVDDADENGVDILDPEEQPEPVLDEVEENVDSPEPD